MLNTSASNDEYVFFECDIYTVFDKFLDCTAKRTFETTDACLPA